MRRAKERRPATPEAGAKGASKKAKAVTQLSQSDYERSLAKLQRSIVRTDVRDWVRAHIHYGSDPIGIAASAKGITIDCQVFFQKYETPKAQLNVLLFEAGKALAAIVQDRSDRWREAHSSDSADTEAFAELRTLAAQASQSQINQLARKRGGQRGSGIDPAFGAYENTVGVLFRELALTKTETPAKGQATAKADDAVAKLGAFIEKRPLITWN
jgi:hypothetical protein